VLSATSNRVSVWIISIFPTCISLQATCAAQQTDQSWARHPHREPLATLQLGADKPRFFSGAADYAITF
jgi:hypothetical protein